MELKYTIFKMKAKGGLLVTRDIGKSKKEEICEKLDELETNGVLIVDFSDIKFIDASCADEIVVRVMARLEAGEYPDRYVLYRNIAKQHIENINLALTVAEKLIIAFSGRKWWMLGFMIDGYRTALRKVVELKETTAREFQVAMDYNQINEASTKLSKLYDKCLIAREPFREPVRGGGRQFRYLSLLKDIRHNKGIDDYTQK
jgi:hypothetical protein